MKSKLPGYWSSTCISFLLALISNFSMAQDTARLADGPAQLNELKGFTQAIYFSPGFENRAKDIATFMENAGNYFQKEIGFTPKTKLYILGPQHWKDIAAPPLKDVYGFPHNLNNVELAIAAEDNDLWRSFLPPVDQLPTSIATEVTKAYSKPEGGYSMMPFFDLLALHEMGHSYAGQAGLKTHRHWLSELFVNIMLHTYIAEKEPELLPALEAFPNMVIAGGATEFKYTTLKEFEDLYATMGMGPKNYGWFQCRFHSAAKDIYNAGGKDILKKLWNALKKHQEKMSDQELINMLQNEVHPSVANVFLKWSEIK